MAITDIYVLLAVFSQTIAVVSGSVVTVNQTETVVFCYLQA